MQPCAPRARGRRAQAPRRRSQADERHVAAARRNGGQRHASARSSARRRATRCSQPLRRWSSRRDRARRPRGQGADDQLQPAARDLERAEVPEPRAAAQRPDPGGRPRADPGDARSSTGGAGSSSRRTRPSGSGSRCSGRLRTRPGRSGSRSTSSSASASWPRRSASWPHKLGREPSEEELASAAEMELAEVIALREAPQATASLDKPIDDEGETALGDLLESGEPEPIEEVAAGERTDVVASALDELSGAGARGDRAAVRPLRRRGEVPRRDRQGARAELAARRQARDARPCSTSSARGVWTLCATRPRRWHGEAQALGPRHGDQGHRRRDGAARKGAEEAGAGGERRLRPPKAPTTNRRGA